MLIDTALADTDTITIQDSESTPDAPPAIESGLTSLIPMVLIFVVFCIESVLCVVYVSARVFVFAGGHET